MIFVGVGRLCMGCGWDRVDLCCCSATVTFFGVNYCGSIGSDGWYEW